jgi:peptide/nickel transport system substrate-binding protein
MAFPTAAIQSLFAYYRYLVIQPREGEDKIDLRQDMRGTGPWTLTKYTPSASFEWAKNPEWYISGRPYLDGISQPIVTEYATGLSQFKAGNIWQYAVRPEDVVATKKAEQRLTMFARGNFGLGAGYNLLGFSQKPNQPYTDVRLRQATSMAIDRDLWIETFFNVSKFEAEGLPVRTAWFSHIHPGYPRYYVDPKSSEFGENGKYFKYDVAEAKKLAAAAGVTRPLEVPLAFQQVSATGQKEAEVLAGFLETAGLFKPTLKALDPDGWLREAHTGGGTWDGLTAGIPTGGGPDIDQLFSARYISGASQYSMFPQPLPKIHDLMVKQRLELDANKREQLIKLEIARTMAAEMPAVPMGGVAEAFDLVWPHLANYGVFQTPERYEPMDVYPFLWYDASKKT